MIESAEHHAELSGNSGPMPSIDRRGDLLGLRVNGDQTGAVEGPYIRVAVFVQRQIPGNDAARPVAQDASEFRTPVRPVGLKATVV